MEAGKEQDPFASMVKLCQPTASQEEKLRHCPFARESENFAESYPSQLTSSTDSTPSDNTQIFVMVSPPDSVQQVEDDVVFLTPPEHHRSSSEDQNLNELCAEGLKIIDAGDGSDRTKKVRVSELGIDDEPEAKKNRVHVEELENETVPVIKTEVIEIEEDEDVHDGSGDGGPKSDGKRTEDIDKFRYSGDIDRIWKGKTGGDIGGGSAGRRRQLPVSLKGKEKNVEGSDSAVETAGKTENGLPVSLKGKEKNVEGSDSAVETAGKTENGLLNFLDILNIILGDDKDGGSEDVDFLETAKKKGMIFPRPRWWPPEGEGW